MIVGHALLAFAIAATLAGRYVDPERALGFGVVAAAFAVIPDVDVAYGLTGVIGALGDTGALIESFWAAGLVVHRGLTHSLPIGVIAAVAFGLLATAEWPRATTLTGWILLASIVVLGTVGGPLAGLSAGLFVGLGAVIGRVGAERFDLRAVQVTGLAAIGLLSHPFGDLFTGEPPLLLYPLSIELVPARVALAPDPTLHLLGTFALELLAAWLALLVLARHRGARLSEWIAPRAVAGASFGVAALGLAPPTLEQPYLFTAAVLPVGAGVGVTCWFRPPVDLERRAVISVVATGVAALTVALVAYTGVYLAV